MLPFRPSPDMMVVVSSEGSKPVLELVIFIGLQA
jgi:hypothetical protein